MKEEECESEAVMERKRGREELCVSAHLYSKPVCLSISLFHTPSILPPSASLHPALPFPFWGTWLEHYSEGGERRLQTTAMGGKRLLQVWKWVSDR